MDVKIQQQGALGHICLNRPKALNALTLDMIRSITKALKEFSHNTEIKSVLISGAGDKAFCAGGDVKSLWEEGQSGKITPTDHQAAFFKEEYELNYLIATYPKPLIALMHGITMGGGLGISAHAKYRLVTETSLCAMPEMAIGLFPDVGGGYFLNLLPKGVGLWMAITGGRLKAGDAVWSGLATDVISSEDRADLLTFLSELSSEEVLSSWLEKNRLDFPSEFLANQHKLMEDIFSVDYSPEEIIQKLEHRSEDWCQKALQELTKQSPTSIAITIEQMKRCEAQPLAETLKLEFKMACSCMAGHDFYEGVRAVLVEKDQSPTWKPASFDEITKDLVQSHFEDKLPLELELS